jgi:hypothetical protein
LDYILYSTQAGLEIRQLRKTQRRRSKWLPVEIAILANCYYSQTSRRRTGFELKSRSASQARCTVPLHQYERA